MRPPPLWKLRREWARILAQVSGVVGWFVSTPYNDLVLRRRVRISAGRGRAESSKVAIYVIHPSAGVLDSHLEALRYLNRGGYRVIVVSNLTLEASGHARLAPLCAQLLERPNYGYDFGGYREGLHALSSELSKLERLVLVNDSCWFPLPGRPDWLAAAESSGLDITGASMTPAVLDWAYQPFEPVPRWLFEPKEPNYHYGAYALSIGPRMLRDPAFAAFWRRLRLTSWKPLVVRRGEMGLTRLAVARGLSHGATLHLSDLPILLETMEDARLERLARRAIMLDHRELEQAKAELIARIEAGAVDWRAWAVPLLLRAAAVIGPAYTLADWACEEGGLAFLKKSPLTKSADSAAALRAIAAGVEGEFGEIIRRELDAAPAPNRMEADWS